MTLGWHCIISTRITTTIIKNKSEKSSFKSCFTASRQAVVTVPLPGPPQAMNVASVVEVMLEAVAFRAMMLDAVVL